MEWWEGFVMLGLLWIWFLSPLQFVWISDEYKPDSQLIGNRLCIVPSMPKRICREETIHQDLSKVTELDVNAYGQPTSWILSSCVSWRCLGMCTSVHDNRKAWCPWCPWLCKTDDMWLQPESIVSTSFNHDLKPCQFATQVSNSIETSFFLYFFWCCTVNKLWKNPTTCSFEELEQSAHKYWVNRWCGSHGFHYLHLQIILNLNIGWRYNYRSNM